VFIWGGGRGIIRSKSVTPDKKNGLYPSSSTLYYLAEKRQGRGGYKRILKNVKVLRQLSHGRARAGVYAFCATHFGCCCCCCYHYYCIASLSSFLFPLGGLHTITFRPLSTTFVLPNGLGRRRIKARS
jgi:hypothetical protein